MRSATALGMLALCFATISPARAAGESWQFCTLRVQGRDIGDTGLLYVSTTEFWTLVKALQNAGHERVFCKDYGQFKSLAESDYNDAVRHHRSRGRYLGVLAKPVPPDGESGSAKVAKARGGDSVGALSEEATKAQPAVNLEVKGQIASALQSARGKPMDLALTIDDSYAKEQEKHLKMIEANKKALAKAGEESRAKNAAATAALAAQQEKEFAERKARVKPCERAGCASKQ